MNLDKTLLILLIVALVVMGPSQLPKLGAMLGKSAKALRDGLEGADDDEPPAPKPAAAAPVPSAPADPAAPHPEPPLPDGDELS